MQGTGLGLCPSCDEDIWMLGTEAIQTLSRLVTSLSMKQCPPKHLCFNELFGKLSFPLVSKANSLAILSCLHVISVGRVHANVSKVTITMLICQYVIKKK